MSKRNKRVKVKQCVFCSCSDKEAILMQEVGAALAVTCTSCGAIGPIGLTEESALEKWNSRSVAIITEEAYAKLIKGKDVDK